MVRTVTVRLFSLVSLVSLAACSDSDAGISASISGGSSSGVSASTQNPSGDASTAGEPTSGEPTSGGIGETGSTSSGTVEATSTSAGPDETTSTSGVMTTEADTSTGGPDTTTTGTGTDTSTGTSSGTDTTGMPGDTTGGGDPNCQAPAVQPPCDAGTNDPFKAIGLNCSEDKSMAIPIKNAVITSPDSSAWRVATHYGTAMDPMEPGKYMWGPKEGERLLVIGTGTFPALQPDGGLVEPDSLFGENVSSPNGNPDNQADLPGIMTYKKGSNGGAGGTPFMNCDGVGDCSDTLDAQWNIVPNNRANDVFYMSFDLDVPLGTHGYMFDFAYFSQEWPTYVGDAFNDMFVVWSTSESFTGNVTFINDQPLTVTALDPYMDILPGSPLLAGTGFPDSFIDTEGAGTGWFTAKGSAVPGESFTIAIAIFDMGDDILDTIGLIDHFRWDCVGCIPNEVDSCGVLPQ